MSPARLGDTLLIHSLLREAKILWTGGIQGGRKEETGLTIFILHLSTRQAHVFRGFGHHVGLLAWMTHLQHQHLRL